MVKSQKVSIRAMARMQAIVFGIVGLLLGILYSFGGLIFDIATHAVSEGTALAMLALIGMPLILTPIGYIIGAVVALPYNCVTQWLAK